MKAESVRVFALLIAVLILAPGTWGQSAAAGDSVAEQPFAEGHADVGRFLDDFLVRAKVAADAAGVVAEADSLRREADRMLKAGRHMEARALLQQAGEAIAAAAPDRDAKRDDPFLREYLREVTAALVAVDKPDDASSLSPEAAIGVSEIYIARPQVAAFVNYYTGRGRTRLQTGRTRLAAYRPMMSRIFREEGIPEWLLAVGFVESTYDTSALSPKQALGIWQFIPGTGARFGLQRTTWTDERQHPEKSTRAAARYLKGLHALFGDWSLAIAAYNAGEGRVARVMRRTGVRDFWAMAARGLLPQETINYVPSVLAAAQLLGTPSGVKMEMQRRTAAFAQTGEEVKR